MYIAYLQKKRKKKRRRRRNSQFSQTSSVTSGVRPRKFSPVLVPPLPTCILPIPYPYIYISAIPLPPLTTLFHESNEKYSLDFRRVLVIGILLST